MQEKAGAQISKRAFIQSMIILFVLMLAAGLLTRVIPAGSYTYIEADDREQIDPQSFQYLPQPDYPVWRWFTAPLEVLWGPDGAIIIVIIVFLLLIGGAFAVLDRSGLLKSVISHIVGAFEDRKYVLLLIIALFFMVIGAFFGLFEEVVPLVPLMLALSYLLGWDALVGLGMSILAVNMGFSAAITNPFTIGVAQKLAGLPLFSGAWYRILIFITVYSVFAFFLLRYARKVERNPKFSSVYEEDQAERGRYDHLQLNSQALANPRLGKAMTWFLCCIVLILLVLVLSPFIPFLSDLALPLVGLLFFIGGVGASSISGTSPRKLLRNIQEGVIGIAPAIPLIMMAASVKHIITLGGILDTILYRATQAFSGASPFTATLLIYFLALFIEFFIASGSAKAFLLMPILLPLADLVGVTRQMVVTAYCFGDGFSNMIYPTNPVLLISLGLTVVSYPKWMRWTLKLWAWVLVVTVVFLGVGVIINYGPF